MSGALSHIRVLDLSRVLAGPWAGQVLADLGAEVIKIEQPGRGDDTRAWGPPYLRDASGADTSESAYFLSANRGKRSVTLDLGTDEGQRLARALAAQSDILLENFKVGGLARYGLDYDSLSALNPGLIYCSITGFGQTGPYAGRPGYDFMIQAMGGLMSLTGEPDGEPQKVGVALADVLTGLYATVAVLAALAHRERSGEGQHIDLALLDVQLASLANQAMNYLASGVSPRRLGNAHPNIVPYQAFATADGHVIVAVGNDRQFARYAEVLGCPELAADPRFATNRSRVEHRDELVPLLQPRMATRTSAGWLETLEAAGIPCGPINTIGQVFDDPQIRHRGMRLELPHPLAGTVPLVASPLNFSATPVEYVRPPPTLGQDTEQILGERLGLDRETLEALRAQGVI
ncbi:MAG: CaiB/BaiF CoA-transferase family protein [Candidatus Competibacterales bacterium]|nr:CaiB/BaiF CoA-transferase family protein [Candidatus Competibacterales bacterium]